jgi:transcriptional regulator with XRE-family HTH domain
MAIVVTLATMNPMIGKKLKEAARAKGLADAKVAEMLGISPERYGNYALDKREPDFDILIRICQVLGVTPNYLFGFDPQLLQSQSSAPDLDAPLLREAVRAALKGKARAAEMGQEIPDEWVADMIEELYAEGLRHGAQGQDGQAWDMDSVAAGFLAGMRAAGRK